ncbi:hypothetical protein N866_12555 [Actinotalea ferrariae CF5-4]|uniref:Histidine kinase n=1 Tax=Actinotalea ferrariae CF5-4 TaxID=948458 RepID=A0A021VWA2_9CELL|nr:CDP-archaeol synthase [Actinotalea ferrariae]EYR64315.1 hypothetical protein N866_12555 [Actinotalea ferrariae CF5-4]
MSSTAVPEGDPTPEDLERSAQPARLRRAPRYRGFALAGVVVGVLVAVVAVALSGPAREGAPLDTVSVLLLLAVVLGTFGALLGAAVAVVVDRRSLRASRPASRPASRRAGGGTSAPPADDAAPTA